MPRPIEGDPGVLRKAATALTGRADELSVQRGNQRNAVHAGLANWDGSGSMSFAGTFVTYGKDVDRAVAALRIVAGVVRTYAGTLDRHQAEDRELRRKIVAAEFDVRVLRSEIRVATDPLSTAQAQKELTKAQGAVGDLTRQHDDLWLRHRRAVSTFRTGLERADPPEALWHLGARRVGLAKASIAALTKGRAAVTVIHLERKPTLTPNQTAAHTQATQKLQKGVITGNLDRVPGGGRVVRLLGPLAPVVGILDAARPGIKDVKTGGGYTGWRDAGTRLAGLAQIGGVIAMRTSARLPGAIAIGTWVVWKGANASYDNEDWLTEELPPILLKQVEQDVPAAMLIKYLATRPPHPDAARRRPPAPLRPAPPPMGPPAPPPAGFRGLKWYPPPPAEVGVPR